MAPRVVLIGAPGAGKSTIGPLLAHELHCAFLDSDAVIEEQEGLSIADIFIDKSEPYFRNIEKSVVLKLLSTHDGVLSLGGGSVLDAEVRQALGSLSVAWLQISLADAVERVGLHKSRPLLLGNVRGNMKKLLSERNHIYESVATMKVDAMSSPQAIVRSIVEKLQVS